MKVTAVIFDLDGLMIDTEPLYKVAWQAAASEAGYDLDDARYERLVGRRTEECEHILLNVFGPSFPLSAFRVRWPELWRGEVERAGIEPRDGCRSRRNSVWRSKTRKLAYLRRPARG